MLLLKQNLLFFVLIFSFLFNNLQAQDKAPITGTDLKITLQEGYTIDENSAVLACPKYSITFMEMAGVSFDEQQSDFDDVESSYAEKGIIVKKKQKGKISKYDAILITLDTKPSIYQVFFGNNDFCAFANVIANDTTFTIAPKEVNAILNSIEYESSSKSALEEHANFVITNKKSDWEFMSYVANTYGFENKKTGDALMIIQLPPETLALSSKENLAKQFVTSFQNKMPHIKVTEEGDWKTKKIEGYRMLLDVSEDGNENLGLLYVYVFGNNKSAFALQGMGKKNDMATTKLFDDLLKDLAFKE